MFLLMKYYICLLETEGEGICLFGHIYPSLSYQAELVRREGAVQGPRILVLTKA